MLETRKGVWLGVAAFVVWGFFPLYFRLLSHVPPLEVLCHRILWSQVFLLAVIAVQRGWGNVRQVPRDRKVLTTLCATTILIAVNWYVFLVAVDRAKVLQSSFGYFINPLVSVFLGFAFLRERLRTLQVVSVALAAAGVALLSLQLGDLPWIPLILAFSFGFYGLLRKTAAVDSLTGVYVETLLLSPVALAVLLYARGGGGGPAPVSGTHDRLLLILSGVITAIPLVWFAAAARRLRLMSVGFMQYITPTIHFLLAVAVFGEPFATMHLASFACIWAGLAVYTFDAARDSLAIGKASKPQQ